MCYCCSQSDEQSTFSKTTTTTDNTNPESDTDSDSNSEQKSKPWLSRMFASDKSGTVDLPASSNTTATGDFNAAKHFDLKNVSHDFNRPVGIAAAPGVRQSKTGRKIRWEGQESIKKAKPIKKTKN